MVKSKNDLAAMAIKDALRIRRQITRHFEKPICIYDAVESLGVTVRFVDISSMEGMYSKVPGPLILLSSGRPAGRQAFTCAHELAHHHFDHGTKVDQLLADKESNDPKEFIANCFAGAVLMPQTAITNAFAIRNWSVKSPSATQVYVIANYLGVGYETLLTQMDVALRLIQRPVRLDLMKQKLGDIRMELTGGGNSQNLIVVDQYWMSRPVDIQVDDFVLLPHGTTKEGHCITKVMESSKGVLFRGVASGIGRFVNSGLGWTSFVRVSRNMYVGLNEYRHLEDSQDE